MDPPCPTFNFDELHLMKPEEIIITPLTFEEKDEFKGSYTNNIHIYGLDRNSKKYICQIINFPSYICLELDEYSYDMNIPDGMTFKDAQYICSNNTIYWDSGLASDLVDRIAKKMKDKNLNLPLCHHFEHYEDIYYYSKGIKKPYLYLFFRSNKDKKKFKDLCCRFPMFLNREYQYIKMQVHEQKVSSTMRLMAKKDLRYNQWFKCTGFKVPVGSIYRISNVNMNEYYIDYNTMVMIDQSETSSWFIYPSICGFDFECYGHKGVKRFVSSMEIKDPIFMISVDFMVLAHKSTRKKYCLVYGDCDDIEGSEIIRFTTEQDMLVAFSHLIVYLDPDVILTYNGNNFDYPYLLNRYLIHNIPDHAIPTFGRLINTPTEIYSENWKSSGAGKVSNTFVLAEGRIILDLLPIIKRYYKLRMYTLEYVGNEFLGEGKRKITVADMFDAFKTYHDNPIPENIEGKRKMTRIADYCIQDSALCIDIYEKCQLWYHLYSLSGEGGVSIPDIALRGEQCRCYSQLYTLCHKNGKILSNSKLFDYYYTGGFVGNPIRKVWEYCFTTDFTSLYPSIMQAYNLCYTTFIPIWMWPEIPKEYCEIIPVYQDEPTEHYSISRRNDIKEKLKLRSSGYEVTITDEELLYYQRSFEGSSERLDPENPNEKIVFDPEDLSTLPEKTKRCYEFRFIKKEYLEGFLPRLERCWCAARKIVKKQIKVLNKDLEAINKEYETLDPKNLDEYLKRQKDIRIRMLEIQMKDTQLVMEGNCVNKEEAELINEDDQNYHKEQNERLEEIKRLSEEFKDINSTLFMLTDEDELGVRKEYLEKEINTIVTDLIVKDKTQLAIKIIANSGYGFTGVRAGMLSGVFIAICVTFLGRSLVNKANDVLVEYYKDRNGVIVYNDTDSSMLSIDIYDGDDLEALGMEMEDILSGRDEKILPDGTIIPAIEAVFKEPLKMEFENVCQMCPIKPKFYLKAIRETKKEKIKKNGPFKLDKEGKPDVMKKGVLTAKRGNSKFAMNVYNDLSNHVLFLDTISNTFRSLSKHAVELLNDTYKPRELTKVTELGSDYVEENFYMNVFAKNLTMIGFPVRPGDRLEYIIVKTAKEAATGKEESVGMKCREISVWEGDQNRETIDYEYYIEKGLQAQYDDLFDVGFNHITSDPRFERVGYQPKFSRCHFVHFKEPVKMVAAMVKDYFKPTDKIFGDFMKNSFGADYNPSQFSRNKYISSLIEWEILQVITFVDKQLNLPSN